MLPLLYGSDQSLDPLRMALLPLRRRDLVVGLFAASWVGAPPVATLILAAGAVAGFWTSGIGSVLVIASGVAVTVLAISTGLGQVYRDDHEMLRHGMVMYDALYAWCRQHAGATGPWPPRT